MAVCGARCIPSLSSSSSSSHQGSHHHQFSKRITFNNTMFLPVDKWSPRYEKQFYTIRMDKYTIVDRPPTTSTSGDAFNDTCNFLDICGSKNNFPAVYYEISVFCGTEHNTCLRRYSQFLQLCNKLDPNGSMGIKKLLPQKTHPFHKDTDAFLVERMEGLYRFMKDILVRPECVNNSLIEQFLDIQVFSE